MNSADLAEMLDASPSRDADVRCWSALARVVDDDPTFVYGDGAESGMTVTCQVLTGPFTGAEVAAMISCPLGSTDIPPFVGGERLLLHFLDGDLDGLIVVGASVPGGDENPFPTAAAGMSIEDKSDPGASGVKAARVTAPPKGVGVRFYVRGAAFVVRLKGAQEGYAGELYIEADDAKNDPNPIADRKNGTFIRLVRDDSGSFGFKVRTAEGAYINALKDAVSMADPTGANMLSVSSDGVEIYGTKVMVQADLLTLNGGVTQINVPPGTPAPALLPMAALRGIGGPPNAFVGLSSTTVFIGA